MTFFRWLAYKLRWLKWRIEICPYSEPQYRDWWFRKKRSREPQWPEERRRKMEGRVQI